MADLNLIDVPTATGATIATNLVAADSAGDTAPAGAGRFLYVENADVSAHSVTVVTPDTIAGFQIDDLIVSVPAGDAAVIALSGVFADPTTKRAAISYSAVTAVSVAAFALPGF